MLEAMKIRRLFVLIYALLIPSLLSAQEQYYHETYWQNNSQEVYFYQGFSNQEGGGCYSTPNHVRFDSFLRYIIYLEENRASLVEIASFYGFNLDGVLEVPDHIQYEGVDYPVTEVYKILQSELKTIICPATVTYFGGVRSQYNPELQSVILKGVKIIGNNAFKDCNFSIEFPSSLEKIGNHAFEGCTSIKDLSLERVDRIGEWAFTNSSLKTLSLGSVGYIENNAFTNADSLESVSISEFGADLLPEKSFYRCDRLRSVSLGEGLKEIGRRAFAGCISIEEVSLPQSLTTIGEEVFFDNEENGKTCSVLKKVNFPDNLKSIGNQAFRCTAIEEAALPDGLTDLGRYVFAQTPLKSVRLPESLTYIPSAGFYFTLLQKVNVPATCTFIDGGAFECCYSLEVIELPVGLKEIGHYAFCECVNLKELKFPEGLEVIEPYAFQSCKSLKEMILPEGLEVIGAYANSGCEALETISFPSTMKEVRPLGGGFQDNTKWLSLQNVKDVYCHAFFDAVGVFTNKSHKEVTLHVPHDLMQQFHDSEPWCYFSIVDLETGEPFDPSENPSEKVCAKPSIAIDNGELIFTCETEDVEYVTTITCYDVGTLVHKENIKLAASYIITSYAKREGYKNSEIVKATLFWLPKGNNEEIGIDEAVISSRPVLISSNGGTLIIQGAEAGCMITVYDLSGRRLSAAKANGATTSIATTLKKGDTAIVRIGEKSMKVLMD